MESFKDCMVVVAILAALLVLALFANGTANDHVERGCSDMSSYSNCS